LHLAVSRPALIGFYEAQDKQISTATTSWLQQVHICLLWYSYGRVLTCVCVWERERDCLLSVSTSYNCLFYPLEGHCRKRTVFVWSLWMKWATGFHQEGFTEYLFVQSWRKCYCSDIAILQLKALHGFHWILSQLFCLKCLRRNKVDTNEKLQGAIKLRMWTLWIFACSEILSNFQLLKYSRNSLNPLWINTHNCYFNSCTFHV